MMNISEKWSQLTEGQKKLAIAGGIAGGVVICVGAAYAISMGGLIIVTEKTVVALGAAAPIVASAVAETMKGRVA